MSKEIYIAYTHASYGSAGVSANFLGYANSLTELDEYFQKINEKEKQVKDASVKLADFARKYPKYFAGFSAKEFGEAVLNGTINQVVKAWQEADYAYKALDISPELIERTHTATIPHQYAYKIVNSDVTRGNAWLVLNHTDTSIDVVSVHHTEQEAGLAKDDRNDFNSKLHAYRAAVGYVRYGLASCFETLAISKIDTLSDEEETELQKQVIRLLGIPEQFTDVLVDEPYGSDRKILEKAYVLEISNVLDL